MKYAEAIEYLYRLRWFGVKLGLEHISKLLDALGHPEKYPKETFLFVNVDEALDLTKASTWRLFLNYLESRRKKGDTAAIRRIFEFLRKRNAIKMAQGLSALPTTQIREFIPIFAELPDLLADSTFQTLARELVIPYSIYCLPPTFQRNAILSLSCP